MLTWKMRERRMKLAVLARLALAFVIAACSAAAAQATSPEGRWITASHNLIVSIAPCGPVLCGTVTEVLANNSMSDAGASTAQPLPVGYQLITGLRRDGDHWTGRIFNRENGRTYDCTVRKLADGTLEVRPYVVLPLAGRTQIWAPAGN